MGVLTGCGGGSDDPQPRTTPPIGTTTTTSTTEAATEEPIESTTTEQDESTTTGETTTTGEKTTTTLDPDACPGVGKPCTIMGADNLACCGTEFGPGKAFCQTDPEFICCSGSTYAISCGPGSTCGIDDNGLPNCGNQFSLV